VSFNLRFDPLPASPKFQNQEFGGGEALDEMKTAFFAQFEQPLPPNLGLIWGKDGMGVDFGPFVKTILRTADSH